MPVHIGDIVLAAPLQYALLVLIVAARLFVPLLIPRMPLMIVVALVIDAADGPLLATFTHFDTSETGAYQSVDKALDIYYLSIAYLATMRNWTSHTAFRVGQFLFYFRLVGVVLFELTDDRLMLLLFPNTFEYFFIAYEIARLRYDPSRFSARFWVLVAAALWVFVKIPQEYWIHIARLSFIATVRDYPVFGVGVAVALVLATLVVIFVIVPRLPAPDWNWRARAGPRPSRLPRPSHPVLSVETLEKVCLLALLCVIFASILPGIGATSLQVVVGVAAIVLVNAGISLATRGELEYAALLATNLALVYIAKALLSGRHEFALGIGLFFAFLITTIIWLYDAFRPVYDRRFRAGPAGTGAETLAIAPGSACEPTRPRM